MDTPISKVAPPALALALGVGLSLTVPLARGDTKPPTIGVEEIHEGMKGYGLTVFKGTEPERFDVEVIGVLHNFRPSQELILVKTPHPRLDITKNVKGMSGSPIYLDGRLAGAYAYSWSSFQVEPVAGVTPIAPMLREMARPLPTGFWPLAGGAPLPSRAHPDALEAERADRGSVPFRGAPGGYNLIEHAHQLAERIVPHPTFVPASTPILLAGVGTRAASFLRTIFEPLGLEPLQAGGGQANSPVKAPEHYTNGGALGVQLVRGDVSFMGLGTVTQVSGSRLCAFGHPMMNGGASALPAAIGSVLWIFASGQHSSKIGEAVRPLGTLVQDRESAVVVDETIVAPTIPIAFTIEGAEKSSRSVWHMEAAEDRFLTPSLVAAALGSAVESTASERHEVSYTLVSKLRVRGHGTLQFDEAGVAFGSSISQEDFAGANIVRAIGDVLNNPWEIAHIDGVEATLRIQHVRDVWRLRGVELQDVIVDAGASVRLRVHLQLQGAGEVVRVIEVPIAVELAGKDVELEIIPGYEAVPEMAPPENLTELLALVQTSTLDPKSIVVQYRLPSMGLAYHGHVARRLPGFALDALRPTQADIGPDPFASLHRTVVRTEHFLEGKDKIKVKVRPLR